MTYRAFGGFGALFVAATAAIVACGDDDGAPPSSTLADADASVFPSGDSGTGTSDSGGSDPGKPEACGKGATAKGFVGSQSITVDGEAHTYELYLPDAYDGTKSYPVIFVFHGDGGDGAGIRHSYSLESVSGGGAIIVYPDGPGNTWQIDGASAMARDVAFVDAMVDEVRSKYCVAQGRFYATGFSKGAYFVNQLACRSKTTWAGIVTNSGGGPFGTGDSDWNDDGSLKCTNKPLAALQVQGNDDGAVGPDEGMKARDFWRGANGCQESTSPYDPSPCVAYDGCSKPEVWCAVDGLGHQVWDKTSEIAWKFFSK